MKRYNITVDGKAYDVVVEEVSGEGAAVPAPAAPAAAPAPAAAKPAASAPVAAGTKITAPMPGNIIAVKSNKGDSVKKGTVLLILEAMKMENEIVAPVDGKVADIRVKKGDTVSTGDLLVVVG